MALPSSRLATTVKNYIKNRDVLLNKGENPASSRQDIRDVVGQFDILFAFFEQTGLKEELFNNRLENVLKTLRLFDFRRCGISLKDLIRNHWYEIEDVDGGGCVLSFRDAGAMLASFSCQEAIKLVEQCANIVVRDLIFNDSYCQLCQAHGGNVCRLCANEDLIKSMVIASPFDHGTDPDKRYSQETDSDANKEIEDDCTDTTPNANYYSPAETHPEKLTTSPLPVSSDETNRKSNVSTHNGADGDQTNFLPKSEPECSNLSLDDGVSSGIDSDFRLKTNRNGALKEKPVPANDIKTREKSSKFWSLASTSPTSHADCSWSDSSDETYQTSDLDGQESSSDSDGQESSSGSDGQESSSGSDGQESSSNSDGSDSISFKSTPHDTYDNEVKARYKTLEQYWQGNKKEIKCSGMDWVAIFMNENKIKHELFENKQQLLKWCHENKDSMGKDIPVFYYTNISKHQGPPKNPSNVGREITPTVRVELKGMKSPHQPKRVYLDTGADGGSVGFHSDRYKGCLHSVESINKEEKVVIISKISVEEYDLPKFYSFDVDPDPRWNAIGIEILKELPDEVGHKMFEDAWEQIKSSNNYQHEDPPSSNQSTSNREHNQHDLPSSGQSTSNREHNLPSSGQSTGNYKDDRPSSSESTSNDEHSQHDPTSSKFTSKHQEDPPSSNQSISNNEHDQHDPPSSSQSSSNSEHNQPDPLSGQSTSNYQEDQPSPTRSQSTSTYQDHPPSFGQSTSNCERNQPEPL